MNSAFLDRILAAEQGGRSVALATALDGGDQLFVDGEKTEGGLALDAGALASVRDAIRADKNTTLQTASGRVFVQVFSPPRRCFVIGAAHISQPLVQMLALADYRAFVIDPRAAFATQTRFPGVELSTDWPDEALERYKPDQRSAIVTLTHDPKIDDPALIAALRSECFYIGALGSRKTHAARLGRLAEEGFGPEATSRIHGPIGLALGAVSPAEIAVSIIAQMTQILRQGAAKAAA